MRRTFASDHSSSSYEFYTLRSLSDAEKRAVKRLSGETAKGKHLKVHLWGEGEMAYRKEEQLLAQYYDIEVSESYDWWTARVAVDHDETLWEGLKRCEGRGDEDLGVDVERSGKRIIVSFYFMLDYDAAFSELGDDPFEGLRDLFEEIREEIRVRDFSAPRTVCRFYDAEIEDKGRKQSKNAKILRKILERI